MMHCTSLDGGALVIEMSAECWDEEKGKKGNKNLASTSMTSAHSSLFGVAPEPENRKLKYT